MSDPNIQQDGFRRQQFLANPGFPRREVIRVLAFVDGCFPVQQRENSAVPLPSK